MSHVPMKKLFFLCYREWNFQFERGQKSNLGSCASVLLLQHKKAFSNWVLCLYINITVLIQ